MDWNTILAILLSVFVLVGAAYFFYKALWFVIRGRRQQTFRKTILTYVSFLLPIASVVLYFFPGLMVDPFGDDSYRHFELLAVVGVVSCIIAMVCAWMGERRTAIATTVFSFLAALNWIGTTLIPH